MASDRQRTRPIMRRVSCGERSLRQDVQATAPVTYRHRVLTLLATLSVLTYLDRVCVSVAGGMPNKLLRSYTGKRSCLAPDAGRYWNRLAAGAALVVSAPNGRCS
jgi:hypothetical protein